MTCTTCRGRREIRIVIPYRASYRNLWIVCTTCRGTGQEKPQ